VASWQVLAGPTASVLAPVVSAARAGFQTTITMPRAAAYVQVQALNSAGVVIGTSHTVKG
jgi:hypothetical protein